MSKENKILEEALALRYMDLAGVGHINEEVDIDELMEPVEDAQSGGENLVHPIDHVEVVADESNVDSVEVMDIKTGEVEPSDVEVERVAEAVERVLAAWDEEEA